MTERKYTPNEQRILDVLADGHPHVKYELVELFGTDKEFLDHYQGAMYEAISQLRKKLTPIGEDVVCVIRGRKTYYQWIRLMGERAV